MDGLGGAASVGEGGDDEVGAVDVVAAGEDAGAGGSAFFVDLDEGFAVGADAGGSLGDDGVGAVADGDDDGICGDEEFAAWDGYWAAAAGFVGFAELHALAFDGSYAAVFVAEDAGGEGEHFEADAFFSGVFALFGAAEHFGFGSAVDAGDVFGAEANGGADAVHGGIAAADHDDVVHSGEGAAEAFGEQFGCEVATDEEFGGAVDAFEVFAFDAHFVADAGAGADEDGVEALLEEFVDGDVAADVGVADEGDAHGLEVGDVFVDDVFAHFEVGDAVDEDAAGLGPVFVDGDAVPFVGELFGDGEAGGAGADDGDFEAGRFGHVAGHGVAAELLALVVGAEGFEFADGDWGFLAAVGADGEADDAGAFAEFFLGAEAAAHFGEVGGFAEFVGGAEDVAGFEEGEGAGDVVVDGAGFLAGRGGALDAAGGFDAGGVEVEPEVGFFEVAFALFGVLLGDGLDADGEAAGDVVGHASPVPGVRRCSRVFGSYLRGARKGIARRWGYWPWVRRCWNSRSARLPR